MIAAPLHNAPCLFLAEETHSKSGLACLAVVEAKDLVALAGDFLAAGYHLEDVSGLVAAEGAVSVYHFDHFDTPGRVAVLVVVPLDGDGKATFPSIAPVYQGAEWHERETRDFFGFIYENNPNLVPLLMPETMPDTHPLMKPENGRAPLAVLFSPADRGRTVVKVAEGFTMLDGVAAEEVSAGDAPEDKGADNAE